MLLSFKSSIEFGFFKILRHKVTGLKVGLEGLKHIPESGHIAQLPELHKIHPQSRGRICPTVCPRVSFVKVLNGFR
jgi:hypothetical protein